MKKPQLLIFDINETLLDLHKVKSAINEVLQNKYAFSIWFTTLLQYSMVESICNSYHGFGEIGKSTLKMTAEKLGIHISDDKISEILKLITQLPPHQDVQNGLRNLKSYGFHLVALTNGSTEALKAQMKYANLTKFFDRLFSVEEVQSFKPQALTYRHVLKEMNHPPEESMMIAAHPWDLAGAKAVGMQTAFIERPGQIYYPLLKEADYMVKDLEELTDHLKMKYK
jgi:2-haloacid dehalogenase